MQWLRIAGILFLCGLSSFGQTFTPSPDRLNKPSFPDHRTTEQKRWLARIEKAGAEARIDDHFQPFPEAKPEPLRIRTEIERESLKGVAPIVARVVPLLKELPGIHSVSISVLDWDEADVKSLELLQGVEGLQSVWIRYRKLPPGGEEGIRRQLPRLNKESLGFSQFRGMDLARLLPVDPNADELEQLRIQSYNASVQAMRMMQIRHQVGRVSSVELYRSQSDMVAAIGALAIAPAEKLAWLERRLETIRAIEQEYVKAWDAGQASVNRQLLLLLRDLRLTAEIEVLEFRGRMEKRP